MDNDEYLLINKTIKKTLSNRKYSWIVNSDILLSRDDLYQELFLSYLLDYKWEISKQNLLVFFKSRLINIKRYYDRKGDFERSDLTEDFVFEDSNKLREVVIDSFKTLDNELTKRELDVLFSYYVYGETHQEISERLGYANESVVRKLIKRTLDRIKPGLVELLDHVKPRGVNMC